MATIELFAVLRITTLEKYGCNQVLEQFMDHIHCLESVNLAHPIFFITNAAYYLLL